MNYAQQIAVNKVESISRSYTAGVMYKAKEPPKPTPTKKLKKFAMTAEFDVDKREPKSGELGLLQGWWNGQFGLQPLPNADARQAVRSGKTEVSVVGHASRTGAREYNLVLAKDRADHITKFLVKEEMMGGQAHLNDASAGFDDATARGEAQTERYVAVFFEAMVEDEAAPAGVSGTTTELSEAKAA